ncbi:hypothetical protein GXW82_29975 [Streptacidiphilus sp. 4-A2]|nr:hypothetical protein [Streptacidiphilus sp. 4-A2]
MGIESDQLVYDYLSRVGDLAQATTLTAAERARLVTGLRQAIDDRRGDSSSGSSGTSGSSGSARAEKASVQKILTGIGTPADVVRQAVHSGVPESQAPAAADGGGGRSGAWGLAGAPSVPVQASASPTGDGAAPASGPADWWRNQGADQGADEGGLSPLIGASIGELPGWRAVYEPDFLDPDADERAARVPGQRGSLTDDLADPEGEGVPGGAEAVDQGAAPVPGFRRLLRVLRPAPAVDAGVDGCRAGRCRWWRPWRRWCWPRRRCWGCGTWRCWAGSSRTPRNGSASGWPAPPDCGCRCCWHWPAGCCSTRGRTATRGSRRAARRSSPRCTARWRCGCGCRPGSPPCIWPGRSAAAASPRARRRLRTPQGIPGRPSASQSRTSLFQGVPARPRASQPRTSLFRGVPGRPGASQVGISADRLRR